MGGVGDRRSRPARLRPGPARPLRRTAPGRRPPRPDPVGLDETSWAARAVTRHRGGRGQPRRTYVIGLGCETRHAHRLVCSDGLDLTNASATTPIGMGCRGYEHLDRPSGPPRRRPAPCAPTRTAARSCPVRWRSLSRGGLEAHRAPPTRSAGRADGLLPR
ncbi:DNA-binding protein [Streptomyces sp. e14]|nr:DNA-binding protein [Streptomyces sp. e14]